MYTNGNFITAQFLLSKGISLTFLIAFIVALRQYRGLVGEKGVLPAKDFVKEESIWDTISLFYFFPSDNAIKYSAISGILLSIITILGIPSMFTPVFSSLTWLLMWLLFLSFVNTGQKFYEHGWELILLESGFLMIFAGGLSTKMSDVLIWLFRWVLFRMMLGSGLIKLHGDKTWRDLTALNYHFETQPFPNPISWYYHNLPNLVLKSGVLMTHLMLLVVPFLYFLPQPFAVIGGALTIFYQLILFSSGNYTWLNLITAVLAVSTFNDGFLSSINPLNLTRPLAEHPYEPQVLILAGCIGLLSLPVLKNMFSRDQIQNRTFDSIHLVNSYGAFEDVERERNEIILEATEQKNPEESDWKEYTHYAKPGSEEERPPQISPYHHRLDYPFKFADKDPEENHKWIQKLAKKLIEGPKHVENLFKDKPLDNPQKIRVSLYKYRFTTPDEKASTGKWWKTERIKTLCKQEKDN